MKKVIVVSAIFVVLVVAGILFWRTPLAVKYGLREARNYNECVIAEGKAAVVFCDTKNGSHFYGGPQ